jgi:prepilin-type N-terminal cleavage/methylation domain-containing protein
MKRAGFTMIELIFVIVILGILSAVALPKFIGVSEQAKAGKCVAFIGTLNRTTLPAIWADAITDGTVTASEFNSTILDAQMEFPADCNISSTEVATLISNGTQLTKYYGSTPYYLDRNVSASENESPKLLLHK